MTLLKQNLGVSLTWPVSLIQGKITFASVLHTYEEFLSGGVSLSPVKHSTTAKLSLTIGTDTVEEFLTMVTDSGNLFWDQKEQFDEKTGAE
jgi:hypothetical protein